MPPRKRTRPDRAILRKAGPHLRKLQTAKVKGDEVPAAVDQSLPELVGLAMQLVRARQAEEEAGTAEPGMTTRAAALPCSKYNTWWDAFKSSLGFESEWEGCMCRNYGGVWCE
jgi:hypothetical protein